MGQKIKIRCTGNRFVDINDLVDFQGRLKELSVESAGMLRMIIEKYGFCFPVSVWKHNGINYFIDGHQRIAVVREMINHGWSIGPIPVDDIEADNKNEAAELLLASNSSFGEITGQGLYEFATLHEITPPEITDLLQTPEIDLEKFHLEFFTDEPVKDPGSHHVEFEAKDKIIKCPKCGTVIENV
jgi:hypothetical protein